MVVDEMISTGHARALLAVENPEEQYNLAQRIFDEKMSVREVEEYMKEHQITDVLVLYNITNFISDRNLYKLVGRI